MLPLLSLETGCGCSDYKQPKNDVYNRQPRVQKEILRVWYQSRFGKESDGKMYGVGWHAPDVPALANELRGLTKEAGYSVILEWAQNNSYRYKESNDKFFLVR